MALITRVSRLFQADLHAVLDRIEEPDVLLRQAVREMEEALSGDEQRLKLLIHEQELTGVRHDELGQSLNEIEEELNVCFESGKEDLARKLVKRKLETLRYGKLLRRKKDELDQAITKLSERLDENRAQLDSMRQKAELLAQETHDTEASDHWDTPEILIRDEDVEVAFLREKQRRERP